MKCVTALNLLMVEMEVAQVDLVVRGALVLALLNLVTVQLQLLPVGKCPDKSVKMCQNKSVIMCPDRSAEMFPKRFLDK